MHESKRKQEAVSFEELSEKASGILRKHPERKRDPIPDEPLDPGRRSLWGVDMKEKGLSKGEFNSVCQAVGGYEKLIDPKCKDKNLLALVQYLSEEDKKEKILENQKIIRTPIVRNGKQATVGYEPDVWKDWK